MNAVLMREYEAWVEIVLCESWLAQFDPNVEARPEHQDVADYANQRAARLAERLGRDEPK